MRRSPAPCGALPAQPTSLFAISGCRRSRHRARRSTLFAVQRDGAMCRCSPQPDLLGPPMAHRLPVRSIRFSGAERTGVPFGYYVSGVTGPSSQSSGEARDAEGCTVGRGARPRGGRRAATRAQVTAQVALTITPLAGGISCPPGTERLDRGDETRDGAAGDTVVPPADAAPSDGPGVLDARAPPTSPALDAPALPDAPRPLARGPPARCENPNDVAARGAARTPGGSGEACATGGPPARPAIAWTGSAARAPAPASASPAPRERRRASARRSPRARRAHRVRRARARARARAAAAPGNRMACTFPGATTQCREPSCAASTGRATLAAACNGAGACPAVETVDCAPNTCAGTICAGGCSDVAAVHGQQLLPGRRVRGKEAERHDVRRGRRVHERQLRRRRLLQRRLRRDLLRMQPDRDAGDMLRR